MEEIINSTSTQEQVQAPQEESTTPATIPESGEDNWDDIDLSDLADDEEPAPKAQEEAEQEADQQDAEAENTLEEERQEAQEAQEGQEGQDKPAEEQEAEDQQLFELKHQGQLHKVSREQVVTLAQKGMDYDHIRGERDSARAQYAELEAFLSELAQPQGMTIPDLIDHTRASILAERDGIEMDVALQRVKLDRDRKSFEEQQRQAEQAKNAQTQEEARIQQSFLRFAEEYAEVDPKSIPKEVWDAFGKGGELTDAYARWENKQLRQQIKAMQEKQQAQEQNEKNKERSTGSQQSAGSDEHQKRDPIDEDWYSGD